MDNLYLFAEKFKSKNKPNIFRFKIFFFFMVYLS